MSNALAAISGATDDDYCPGCARIICVCPPPPDYFGEQCPHDSLSGDEGPIAELGRWPMRWRCDECGAIKYDKPT